MKFGIARSGPARRSELIPVNKKLHEFGGPGSGKFPVGWKVSVVNGNVVGVPFDAHVLAT